MAQALVDAALDDDADRPVRQFSGGMKRRLEIARGLMHRPRILFLDEPTLGLDVRGRARVWAQLRRLHGKGETTIFLTTHSMDEADALCERIGIIDSGRLVAEGSPAELKAALGGDVVILGLEGGEGAEAALGRIEGVRQVEPHDLGVSDGCRLRITVADGPRRLPALLEAARPFGVIDVSLHRPSLEHVFLHHTGHPFEPERLGEEGRSESGRGVEDTS